MARDERRDVLVLATNALTASHIRAEAASIIHRFRNVTRVHIANAMLLPRSKLAEAISTHVGDIVCALRTTLNFSTCSASPTTIVITATQLSPRSVSIQASPSWSES